MAVPLFGLPGGLPAASPAETALPPATATDEMNRTSGPESASLVASGSTITQPLASGIMMAGGTGPQFVLGGPAGPGSGGGLREPPTPARMMDWKVTTEPKP